MPDRPPIDDARAAAQIERLRDWRARREPDLSLARILNATAEQATRTEKRLGAIIDAWLACVPAHLARRTTITGYGRGVIEVAVESSSVSYELNALLRGGLLDELRAAARTPVSRVRIVVRAGEDDPPSAS